MRKSKGFRSDEQRRGFFNSVKNKGNAVRQRIPSRRNRETRDHLNRLDKSIEQDKQQLKEYRYKLANVRSSDEKKEMKRKKRITKNRIDRKKEDKKKTIKLEENTWTVMKKTHSKHEDAKKLVALVERRGYNIEEIDWDELKGEDLSYEQKERILLHEIHEDTGMINIV